MPIYEFRCRNCQGETSILVKSIFSSVSVKCPYCSSSDLVRLISSFGIGKTIKSVHEASGSPENPGPDYYKDPRNIGRWAEKKFSDMGMEMPSQLKEKIDAAREGEMPGEVKGLQTRQV